MLTVGSLIVIFAAVALILWRERRLYRREQRLLREQSFLPSPGGRVIPIRSARRGPEQIVVRRVRR